jgi:serine/threonine protein kinase
VIDLAHTARAEHGEDLVWPKPSVTREWHNFFVSSDQCDGVPGRRDGSAPSQERTLSPDEVLRYAVEMADALDTAHRHRVIHRDLKPGNVMSTKSGAKAA